MAANLTDWERRQLESIDKLIIKCKLRCIAFELAHLKLNGTNGGPTIAANLTKLTPEGLRYFATDLYSVLDYLCYLCYCHYKNNQPNNSTEERNVKFQKKDKLKISDFPGQEKNLSKGREKFAQQVFDTIFTAGKAQVNYNDFKKLILDCQVLTEVDGNGKPLPQQPTPEEDARNFSHLYFLRNHTVHRNLVDVVVQDAWLYVYLPEGWHEIKSQERTNDANWQSIKVHPGCWITIPSVGSDEMEVKPLLTIAPALLSLVIKIRNMLLQIAFPKAGIPEFDVNDRARSGLIDGVYIGAIGMQQEQQLSWAEFDSHYNYWDNSGLWAH